MGSRGAPRLALALACALLPVAPAAAQTADNDRRVSGTAGASFGDGDTALALSLAAGGRLAGPFGLEGELAYARNLEFTLRCGGGPLDCADGDELPVTGRAVSLVAHAVIELPASGRPVRPYLLAGAGFAHLRQRYRLALPGAPDDRAGDPHEGTRSRLVPALSVGGGIELALGRGFAAGLDLRSLHLVDDDAALDGRIVPGGRLRTLRIGSRVSWRF